MLWDQALQDLPPDDSEINRYAFKVGLVYCRYLMYLLSPVDCKCIRLSWYEIRAVQFSTPWPQVYVIWPLSNNPVPWLVKPRGFLACDWLLVSASPRDLSLIMTSAISWSPLRNVCLVSQSEKCAYADSWNFDKRWSQLLVHPSSSISCGALDICLLCHKMCVRWHEGPHQSSSQDVRVTSTLWHFGKNLEQTQGKAETVTRFQNTCLIPGFIVSAMMHTFENVLLGNMRMSAFAFVYLYFIAKVFYPCPQFCRFFTRSIASHRLNTNQKLFDNPFCQRSEKMSRSYHHMFQVEADTVEGELVAVTGSSGELGRWGRSSVLPLVRESDHRWQLDSSNEIDTAMCDLATSGGWELIWVGRRSITIAIVWLWFWTLKHSLVCLNIQWLTLRQMANRKSLSGDGRLI